MSTTIFVRTPGGPLPEVAPQRRQRPPQPLRDRSTAQWYGVAVVGFNQDPPDAGIGLGIAGQTGAGSDVKRTLPNVMLTLLFRSIEACRLPLADRKTVVYGTGKEDGSMRTKVGVVADGLTEVRVSEADRIVEVAA